MFRKFFWEFSQKVQELPRVVRDKLLDTSTWKTRKVPSWVWFTPKERNSSNCLLNYDLYARSQESKAIFFLVEIKEFSWFDKKFSLSQSEVRKSRLCWFNYWISIVRIKVMQMAWKVWDSSEVRRMNLKPLVNPWD